MTDSAPSPTSSRLTTAEAALSEAATAALCAPSIHNTQPWSWRVRDGRLELSADASRQLHAIDREGRMLTVSCGVALQHALVALAALGYRAEVHELPDPVRPELLAVVEPGERQPPTAVDRRRYQAMMRRRTDRRPFGSDPVTDERVAALRDAAAAYEVGFTTIRPDQLAELAVAATTASTEEIADPAYRAELATWTSRPDASRDGVPAGSTVADHPRPVPLRAFRLDGGDDLAAGGGADVETRYAILAGRTDGRRAWLRGGEALGAVLVTATDLGLGASPMTDLVEVTSTRVVLRRMLSWLSHPYVVLRFGVPTGEGPVPPTPRRDASEVIDDPAPDGPGDEQRGR